MEPDQNILTKEKDPLFIPPGGTALLSVEQVARVLGCSPRTIYNGLGENAKDRFVIKSIKVGRRVLFHSQDVKKYVDSLRP